MPERCWIVGSLPDCDIRVENTAVSGRHCRLTQRGESLLLEDLGSTNGTFVGGKRINGPRIVRRGDRVTLGSNTPLPWPPVVRSVTIGRLPENDIVIPLDMISGQHARLEQEGDAVYLIDLGSKNGTAVNDPLSKITRTALQPTDHVFFGTHRVAAWELLKALPRPAERQSTAMEAGASAELEQELASDGRSAERGQAAGQRVRERFGSKSSWRWGIALSALCVIVILGGPHLLRSKAPNANDQEQRVDPHSPQQLATPQPIAPIPAKSEVTAKPPKPDESLVRQSTSGMVLVGLRIGDNLAIGPGTGWACRSDAIICPTATIEMLERNLAKGQGRDESLVVCNREKTVAILSHIAGRGAAAGFSLAKLEAPLGATCSISKRKSTILPGQELAILTAHCDQHDPRTTSLRYSYLAVDRIERAADTSPILLHCKGEAHSDDLQGSPVFDGTGSVVGCARASVSDVEVVPVAQLLELLPSDP